MTPDQRKKLEDLALQFVENTRAISPECFGTVVITYNNTALVVGNDNPVNAMMGIASSKPAADLDFGVEADTTRFIYAGNTKH